MTQEPPKKPFQISLRFALLLMALVAFACWWIWSPVYFRRVSLGMTEQEVSELLGSPWDVRPDGQTIWWSYPANTKTNYESGELLIRFGLTGEVVDIRRLPPERHMALAN